MSQFAYQIKQAWAGLSTKPGFVATVITTMGLTLGALLCVLTLGYLMLLQPLPYPEQDRLYRVSHDLIDAKGDTKARAYTYPTIVHLYDEQSVFTNVAMIQFVRDVLLSHPLQPVIPIAFTTPEWFALLDVPMLMGRPLEPTEGRGKRNAVAVISYQSWQAQFGGRPDILEQKINFSGVSFSIVGVTGESFVEPHIHQRGLTTSVWLPWELNFSGETRRINYGTVDRQMQFIGKLSEGVSVAQAEQTLTPLVSEFWKARTHTHPFFKDWRIGMVLEPFKTVIVGDSKKTLYMLLAGVLGLVLLACANITNLFMSRTAEQQRQLAVHAALGAKKSDLFRTLFAQAGLLMTMSVLIALVIAMGGFIILQQYLDNLLPRVSELSINHITLGAAVLTGVVFAYGFSRLSANMIDYRAINASLQSSGKGTGIQVSKRIRKALIASQIAIVTTLVFVNISLFKEAMQTIERPLAIHTDDIVQMDLSLSSSTDFSAEQRQATIEQLVNQFEQLPEVESVSLGTSPLSRFGTWVLTAVEADERIIARGKDISHHYFKLFGQAMLEGDNFSEADIKDSNNVMVVNDVMAKALAPNASAVGLHFAMGLPTNTRIIGVVKGVLLPGETEIPMRVYVPVRPNAQVVMLKLKSGQALSRELAVTTLKSSTSLMTIFNLQTLKDSLNQLLFTEYATAVTTAALTIISFFLAAVGLYGIFSYATQLRRFELGTRLAIGAKKKDLVGLIIQDNRSPVLVGIVISMVTLLLLYLGLPDSLVNLIQGSTGISGGLIGMYVVTLALIGLVSLVACYLPLREIIHRPAIHSLRHSD